MALVDALGPLRAIAWVQWRTSHNLFLRANRGSTVVKWLFGLLWYGMWASAGAGVAFLVSGRVSMTILERALPGVLFLIFFFWQMFPIILASQGAFIDLRRLLVYPIPTGQLFLLEVVLRITTAFEMFLVCAGLALGLSLNREIPWWSLLTLPVFMAFNLLLASGIKSLMARLFKKKGVRELMMLVFLAMILGPQFFAAGMQNETEQKIKALQSFGEAFKLLPWAAAADLALGHPRPLAIAGLTVCVILAYLFARLQFARSLLLEEGTETEAPKTGKDVEAGWFDRLARLPSKVLLDPVAIIVEKDIRTLSRSPRFRLIFLMGSTFGAVLWLPYAIRNKTGWLIDNYVTMAALYGMLVIGEVIYWNVFGFERAGAQVWFVTPMPFRDVLRAKNAVALLVTSLVVLSLSVISAVLPINVGLPQAFDAFAAMLVFLVFVMAGGNISSVYMPRPVDGNQAWRNSGGKTQILLLFVYPFLTIPIGLAQLARWATGSYWAFHGILAVSLIIGLCFYSVATETAAEVAEERKEQLVGKLSNQDGPISITT